MLTQDAAPNAQFASEPVNVGPFQSKTLADASGEAYLIVSCESRPNGTVVAVYEATDWERTLRAGSCKKVFCEGELT